MWGCAGKATAMSKTKKSTKQQVRKQRPATTAKPTPGRDERPLIERDAHLALGGIPGIAEQITDELVPLLDAIHAIAHPHGDIADETRSMTGREAQAIAALAFSLSGQLAEVAEDLEHRVQSIRAIIEEAVAKQDMSMVCSTFSRGLAMGERLVAKRKASVEAA